MGRGTQIQDIAFIHDQPAPIDSSWRPNDYDFCLYLATTDIFLNRIMLYNCTRGIRIKEDTLGGIGRITLDQIWGQPLVCGIRIQAATDVVSLSNIRFWDFWKEIDSYVNKWTQGGSDRYRGDWEKPRAIQVFRADNPLFSCISIIHMYVSIGFESYGSIERNGVSADPSDRTGKDPWLKGNHPTGREPTSKFKLVGADLDGSPFPILIRQYNSSGMIANVSSQNSESGIRMDGSGNRLQISNVRITQCKYNAIRFSGKGNIIMGQNLWFEGWNWESEGKAAVAAIDGSQFAYSEPLFFDRGFGGPIFDNNGTGIYQDKSIINDGTYP